MPEGKLQADIHSLDSVNIDKFAYGNRLTGAQLGLSRPMTLNCVLGPLVLGWVPNHILLGASLLLAKKGLILCFTARSYRLKKKVAFLYNPFNSISAISSCPT